MTHPDYPEPYTCMASDEPEAITMAAFYWGRKWTDYNFYAFCSVISEKSRH